MADVEKAGTEKAGFEEADIEMADVEKAGIEKACIEEANIWCLLAAATAQVDNLLLDYRWLLQKDRH